MSDPREGLLKRGEAAATNEQLIRSLSGQLTEEEKALRDLEIVEQAQKYFGGLDEKERALLGVRRGPAIPPRAEDDTEQADPAAETKTLMAFASDWIWAILCGLAFVGVLVWVIRGQ